VQRKCQNIKGSAIGLQLLQNKDCVNNYNNQQILILPGQETHFISRH